MYKIEFILRLKFTVLINVIGRLAGGRAGRSTLARERRKTTFTEPLCVKAVELRIRK